MDPALGALDGDKSESTATMSELPNLQRGNRGERYSHKSSDDEVKRTEINRQLASLQLPNMPISLLSGRATLQDHEEEPPTIRILVVADIDLDSASMLAESALTSPSSPAENPLKRIDLCIACGPFCHEGDLRNYYQGRQRRRHMARHRGNSAAPIWTRGANPGTLLPLPPVPAASSSSMKHSYSYPLKRSREETAAMEGLMTAALSQLESIVCRVLFVPGKADPVTTITSSSSSVSYTRERRLTPNSRNIHQHWIPLCPGLGCGGLLYMDEQKLHQSPPPLEDEDGDEEDPEESEFSDSSHLHHDDHSASYSNHNPADNPVPVSPGSAKMPSLDCHESMTFEDRREEYESEYCRQLQKLVELAPPLTSISDTPTAHAQINSLQTTERFQSIVVTQYHHLDPEVSPMPVTENHVGRSNHHLDSNCDHNRVNNHLVDHEEDEGSIHAPFSRNDTELNDGLASDEDLPWPTRHHEAWASLPDIQEHVFLEIAAGRNQHGHFPKAMDLPLSPCAGGPGPAGRSSQIKVVIPGSLRERGEFALVDVSFMKSQNAPSHGEDDYRWRVRQTRFQTISDYV